MVPAYQSPTLRLLTSIFFLFTVSVSALPRHIQRLQDLDTALAPRNPAGASLHADVPTIPVSKPDPSIFFDALRDFLDQYKGGDIVRAIFGGLLWKNENEGQSTSTSPGSDGSNKLVKTVYVTVVPVPATEASSAAAKTISRNSDPEVVVTITAPLLAPSAVTSVPLSAASGLPSFILLKPTSSPVGNASVEDTITASSTTSARLSTQSEAIFSILPIFPIPSPDLRLNETTLNSTATLTRVPSSAETEAIFSILPIFPIPKPQGYNKSATWTWASPTVAPVSGIPISAPASNVVYPGTRVSAWITPSIGLWPNTTRNWYTQETGTAPTLKPFKPVLSGTVITGWPAQPTGIWPNSTKTGFPVLTSAIYPSNTTYGVAEEQNTTTTIQQQSTATVFVTSPVLWPNATTKTDAGPTETGSAYEYNSTTTFYVTHTVHPFPVYPSDTPPAPTTKPITPSNYSILIPILPSNLTSDPLASLQRLCQAPNPHDAPLTLPLISTFFGPSAYPVLSPFPGCTTPNPSQQLRAPGLLNCTALGAQIQACQKLGRKILLSIKASKPEDVNGDLEYGTAAASRAEDPLGASFGNDTEVEDQGDEQEEDPSLAFVPSRVPPVPMEEPLPNLFDELHPPSSFALSLSSLFGETRTERADLRPLGPDTPSSSTSSSSLAGIPWVTRPLGEEVVLDGFDVQIPREWAGTTQGALFEDFAESLRKLEDDAWREGGGEAGGVGDLGGYGKGVVLVGWV